MNDLIEIKTDISNYKNYFVNVFGHFDELDVIFSEIELKLNDETGWAGESHDKCVEIHNLMKQYKNSIQPICKELEQCLEKLVEDVGDFNTNSSEVQKIKSW